MLPLHNSTILSCTKFDYFTTSHSSIKNCRFYVGPITASRQKLGQTRRSVTTRKTPQHM